MLLRYRTAGTRQYAWHVTYIYFIVGHVDAQRENGVRLYIVVYDAVWIIIAVDFIIAERVVVAVVVIKVGSFTVVDTAILVERSSATADAVVVDDFVAVVVVVAIIVVFVVVVDVVVVLGITSIIVVATTRAYITCARHCTSGGRHDQRDGGDAYEYSDVTNAQHDLSVKEDKLAGTHNRREARAPQYCRPGLLLLHSFFPFVVVNTCQPE